MQDTDFLAGQAAEDPGEFAELYDRLAPALYAWSRYRLHGRLARTTEPEDIVQEVWWRAIDGFPRFKVREGGGSFRAWVFSIATNVFREFSRGAGVRIREGRPARGRADTLPPDLQAQATSITESLRKDDRTTQLVDQIGQLDRDDQRLVLHRGLEGLTAKEVAPLVGQSAETIKKRWQRLRDKLEQHPAWRDLLN